MVFFLHVPRTAGRTYHSCFLKLGRPPSARCSKAYDVRNNRSVSGCSLLGSHDDFSIRQHLPANTAVVTQLRWPVHTARTCRPMQCLPLPSLHMACLCTHAWWGTGRRDGMQG